MHLLPAVNVTGYLHIMYALQYVNKLRCSDVNLSSCVYLGALRSFSFSQRDR